MALNYAKTNTFVTATTLSSSAVNANFDDVVNAFAGLENLSKSLTNLLVDTTLRSSGTIQSADGLAATPAIVFTSDPTTGLYRIGTGDMGFSTSGTKRLDISTTVITAALPLAFSPTTSGVVGTTTNDSASAGNVGQYISSSVLRASAVTNTTTNTWYQLTTISLTAGDWDVSAMGSTFGGSGFTDFELYVGTSSTAGDVVYAVNTAETTAAPTGSGDSGTSLPSLRLSLSGTTTVYLMSLTQFTGGTSKSYGTIHARRAR